MENGNTSDPPQKRDAASREAEAIQPRRHRRSFRNASRPRRSYTSRTPATFWGVMISLLTAYLILLFAAQCHRRALHRERVQAVLMPQAKPAPVQSTERAGLPDDIEEQVAKLIALAEESAGVLDAAAQQAEGGDRALAAERLRAQLAAAPDNVSLKLGLARLLLDEGNRSEAITILVECLRTSPGQHETRLLLAESLLAEKAYEPAAQMAEWILDEDNYNTRAHDIAASAYMLNGSAAAAIPHLRRMATLERDDTAIQNRLAQAHMRAGEFSKAQEIFQDILEIDPDNSVTYYNLAACYALQNLPEQSAQVLTNALRKFDSTFVASWLQGADFDTVRTNESFTVLLTGLPETNGF
ncbi:MAG TPA: tetratricopeptide repeat protein [Kiritimatiellia bacterium]|nr:tetratricopeptide repeat protein [Kiritimatiellia bacterium]